MAAPLVDRHRHPDRGAERGVPTVIVSHGAADGATSAAPVAFEPGS
jgi:hypothetical protein